MAQEERTRTRPVPNVRTMSPPKRQVLKKNTLLSSLSGEGEGGREGEEGAGGARPVSLVVRAALSKR